MCLPILSHADLRDLNQMTLTREERLAGAEESRRVHRELWDAVGASITRYERETALKAWRDHIAGHKATAERIRAEREK